MTKVEYTTQKDTITGNYKVSRDKCVSLKANAKEICVSEAKGMQKVSMAELESTYAPNARHAEKLAMAKADAEYATAKERCNDSSGNAKTICRKDAKAAHVKATDDARVARVDSAATGVETGARNMANKDENEANYKAVTARCDGLTNAAKDTCAAEAKAKYGMK